MYYMLRELFDTLFERHIRMDAELIAETRKTILVKFDKRKGWTPKIWILNYRRYKGRFTKIKISESLGKEVPIVS